jgi:hypothetical protein
MRLRERLQRLESGLAPGCSTCRGWGCRVVYVNDPDSPPPAETERCPRCGREPVTIAVEYTDEPPPAA